jgi:hypothetical protein
MNLHQHILMIYWSLPLDLCGSTESISAKFLNSSGRPDYRFLLTNVNLRLTLQNTLDLSLRLEREYKWTQRR